MADWQKISQFVPGRNANQCQYKWQSNHKPKSTKSPWTAQEDARLKQIVNLKGAKSWAQISRLLNSDKIGSNRQGKQCRERWFNHVNPAIKWQSWTQWQDITLLQKQQSMGNKWSQIAKCIPGRTQNSVKNRFNSLAKKERTKLQEQTKVKNNKKADNTSDLKSSMNTFFKVKLSEESHQIWIKPLLASLMEQYKTKHNSEYDMNNCPQSELHWQHSQQIMENEEEEEEEEEDQEEEEEQEDQEMDNQDDQDQELDKGLGLKKDIYGEKKLKQHKQNKNQRELAGQNKRLKNKRLKKIKQASQIQKQELQIASQQVINQNQSNEFLLQGQILNQEMKNYIIMQQQQQQSSYDGNLVMPPNLIMQTGFHFNRKQESAQQIVTGGGIVIRSPNPSGKQTPLQTLEQLNREGKITFSQPKMKIGSTIGLEQRDLDRSIQERETILQNCVIHNEGYQNQQSQVPRDCQNQAFKKPFHLASSSQYIIPQLKLNNMPYYKKHSKISSQGRMTFANSDYNYIQESRTTSQKGKNQEIKQKLKEIKTKGKKLDEVTRAGIMENGEKFVHNQNFNMLIFITKDSIYLEQDNEMIKIAAIKPLRIGSSSSSSSSSSPSCSPKSKASQKMLQPRKFLELDKVEIATVATNRAQRGSLATSIQNQNSQIAQENQQQAKKKNSQNQQEVKQQLRPQENKTKFEQSFSFMNTKQKQQSFRRGSSSFLSNKRGSMVSMLFDQISQVSQKRSSINQSYPNFFATGPTPKESKNNSNMRFGDNIGVPFQDFLENFQSQGFLDPTTPIGNFQERKSLTSNTNLASSTNQSSNANDSNFNTAAAAAVANNHQSLSNNTPICSSNRLPMRIKSSKQINKISDSTTIVKPNDFMATFGGQPLDDYTSAQQRAAVTESQLRAQNRNYSNRTAPSFQQESKLISVRKSIILDQSMSSVSYSQNLTHSKNSEVVSMPQVSKKKDIPQNNNFGGMFGPITQVVPQIENIPNISKQVSDLNMSNLNLLNSSTINPSLSIFPNSNDSSRPLNNHITSGNNQSVFNQNGLFMNESIFSVPADNRSSRIVNIFENPQQTLRMNKIADQIKSQSNRSRPASFAGESLKFVRNKNQQANLGQLGQRDNGLDNRSLSELSAPFQPYSAPTQLFQFDKQSQKSLAGLLSANQSLGGGGGAFQLNSQKSASNNEDLIHQKPQ